jgi:hypothetical protein
MDFQASTVLYKPARLMVVTSPKVGSTTILSIFVTLAGFEEHAKDPRKFLRMDSSAEKLADKGLTMVDMTAKEIADVREAHPDYTFVGVMRDPTQRLVSGYFNKINRFAKRFAKPVYFWGKLRQILAGPPKWDDINVGNGHMQKFISIEQFVSGMEEHGTEWDNHFALQSRMTGMKDVRYEHVLLLEDLNRVLPDILADCGVDAQDLARLPGVPRLNAVKGSRDFASTLGPDLQARIKALYQEDYDWLAEQRPQA